MCHMRQKKCECMNDAETGNCGGDYRALNSAVHNFTTVSRYYVLPQTIDV